MTQEASTAIDEEQISEEKQINEEYKIWKKNAPYLYDLVVTHALDWPSLSVEWLPDLETIDAKNASLQRLILGTHTSDNEPNYLKIASVTLPNAALAPDSRDESAEELGGYGGGSECKIMITNRIYHDGEINRARYMPQNPCLIATQSSHGSLYVFDYTKHPSAPPANAAPVFEPELRLLHSDKEGYGLAWHRKLSGHLLSCSDDTTICLWDISASSKEKRTLSPVHVFKSHSAPVEDVAWHRFHDHVFGSVSDDHCVMMWDTRAPSLPTLKAQYAAGELNCLSFNPHNEFLLCTGASDGAVLLWDMRALKTPSHVMAVHSDAISNVDWSPFHETILASAGSDRRLNVWDLSRVGMEQDEEDAADGPPELLFVHGGHTNKISDFSWNTNDPWTIASCSEDNILQIWKMASNIYQDQDDEDGDDGSEEGDEEDGQGDDEEDEEPKTEEAADGNSGNQTKVAGDSNETAKHVTAEADVASDESTTRRSKKLKEDPDAK